jgi:hypothetical protein
MSWCLVGSEMCIRDSLCCGDSYKRMVKRNGRKRDD